MVRPPPIDVAAALHERRAHGRTHEGECGAALQLEGLDRHPEGAKLLGWFILCGPAQAADHDAQGPAQSRKTRADTEEQPVLHGRRCRDRGRDWHRQDRARRAHGIVCCHRVQHVAGHWHDGASHHRPRAAWGRALAEHGGGLSALGPVSLGGRFPGVDAARAAAAFRRIGARPIRLRGADGGGPAANELGRTRGSRCCPPRDPSA
mmetsp:Transcript_5825/g.16863  ORF Transcript_5825/g.16863 Transcript_5825/m.16863 type:complete len:206 (+) Transcript_5825:1539-2156(+)